MTILARLYKGAAATGTTAAALARGLVARHGKAVFLDVGARGGLAPRWNIAARARLITPVFVEADSVEAARLARRYPDARMISCAVGAQDGASATLHLTAEPGRSSLLRPDLERIRAYGDSAPWSVVETRPLALRRLDQVWPEDLRGPDFAKVDVQGYELEVLRGLGRQLDQVRALEIEVILDPLYDGQPTLNEVAVFLFAQGFDLVRLAPISLYAGRTMLEFNAFWVRSDRHEDPWVRFWKSMNGVGSARRVQIWGR